MTVTRKYGWIWVALFGLIAYPAYVNIWVVLPQLRPFSFRSLLLFPRISSFFLLPSTFTIILTILLLLLEASSQGQRWFRRLFYLVLFSSVPLFLAARSLFLVPSIMVMGWIWWGKGMVSSQRRSAWSWGTGILAISLIGVVFVTRGLRDIAPNLFYRWVNWKIALAMGWDYLPFGAGSFQYWFQYRHYMPPNVNETRLAHSVPLQLFAEWGLPGLLVFLFLGWLWYRYLMHRPAAERNAIVWQGVGILLAIHNLFDVGIYDPMALAFVGLILILAASSGGMWMFRRIRLSSIQGWIGFALLGMLALRVYGIYPGVPLNVLLAPASEMGPSPPSFTVDALRRQYRSIPSVSIKCSHGLLFQPWDPMLYLICFEQAMKLGERSMAGFYLSTAYVVAPHHPTVRQLWKSWKTKKISP